MKSILLCFANDENQSLRSLKKERKKLSKLLDQGNCRNHFILKEIPNATKDQVIDGLIRYNRSLNVFFFSGHAGKDKLILEDGAATAGGVSGLLKLCKKLDLIILNGCSTASQVKELLRMPSKPAVIATSAPVKDISAGIFSERFFEALVEDKMTLVKAFRAAVSAIRINEKYHDNIINPYKTYRELVSCDESEGVWGLFIPSSKKELKNWKLPSKPIRRIKKRSRKTSKTNTLIIKGDYNISNSKLN